jgi:hypothetical protein
MNYSDDLSNPPCPYCRGEGVATKMVLSQEQRTFTFTCRTCERTWICGDLPTESARTQAPSQQGLDS